MITGEGGQRAVAMMVGEVDSRETANAVRRFCLELRGCCGESFSTERGRTRRLSRILEAVKIRREPVWAPSEHVWALSEQNERGLFLGTVGEALEPVACRLGGLVPPRERQGRRERRLERGVWGTTPKTASKAAHLWTSLAV